MANGLKIKRGDGTPAAGADGSNGVWPYELAWDYTNNKLYINDNGTMREIGKSYSAGTNISLSGTTFNVDDAFLKNDASDTMDGSLTVTGTITVQGGDDFALGELTNTLRMKGNSTNSFNFLNNGNGWAHLNCGNVVAAGSVSIGGHAVNDIDIGSEFVDADDHLMTSGAIKEKIESYGYVTSAGDITGVTAGTGLSGGGNSGGVTLNLDVGDLGLVGNCSIDSGTDTEAEYGSLPVGYAAMMHTNLGTDKGMPASNYFYFHKIANRDTGGGWGGIALGYNNNEQFYVGNTTVNSAFATWSRVVVEDSNGAASITGHLKLAATKALYFDGGSNTYIQEGSGDRLDFVVGGDTMLVMDEANDYNAFYKNTFFGDDIKTYFGSHSDVYLYYEGTNNDFYIRNANGNTKIRNEATDADIIFSNDDGSGGNTNYMVIDGGAVSIDLLQDTRLKAAKKLFLDGGGNTYMWENIADSVYMNVGGLDMMRWYETSSTGYVYCPDNVRLGVGSGIDFTIRHDTTNTYITNTTGDMNFVEADAGNINFRNVSGTSHLYIKSGGNVGINTTSPAEKFHVDGTAKISSTGNTTLYIDGAGNGYTQGQIVFQGTDDDASYRGQGTFYHDAASDIEYFSGTLYANDAWAVTRKTSTSSHDSSVAQGSHALFIIEGGGDVGIGTSNPTDKLHIKDATDISMSSSGNGQLRVEGNGYSGGIALDGNAMHIYHNSSSRSLRLGTDETTRYQIDGSGNHNIYGNTDFSSPMTVQYGVVINEGGHDSDTRIEGDTDTNLVRVDASTERVGIGTGSPGHKLDVNGSIRAQDGNVFYGDSTSGVLSTGSWAGDLVSAQSFERVCGLSHDGGEFVILEKNGQVSTLIDGSYFAYEAGTNQGGGFYSSSDSSYANATGIVASGGTLYVKQADGTNASLFSTGDIICNSGYISGQGNDLHLRRTTNNDDRITIEASEHKFIIDATERMSLTSSGVTCGQINVARNANPNADTTMAINLSGSYGGGIHFTDTKHSGIWCLGSGTEMHFGIGGSTYAGLSGDQGLFMMEDNGDFHANEDVIAFSSSVGSDKKFKKNIKDTSYGLSDVMKMRAVEYDWIEKRKGKHDIGVIAQEIEEIIPEVVQDVKSIGGSEGTHKVVDYGKLASVLIKAIQEQQVQIDELKTKLGE